ncbi:MAG: methylisocitrate lyase [Armatimonadota bacterium]|nr:methylisocitrate lyase [Armatimonadota bacterium]MDR7444127.1 methylisocitrate lyase [Armatimonadota bacterium]MDR7569544.1 methylisocitrate lyase [Armatimonadota bacterium]MDR7613576.1 methylisocitrate lyase [Armatimonadota bacterium]
MTWLVQPPTEEHPALRLRALLKTREVLAVPGVFNALVALLAQKAGFEVLYFSGAAYSASLALPDLGLVTLPEVVEAVRWVVRATRLPVIVDADVGFGEALNVVRTVRELEAVGAAAVQIEDQVMPKRCGHLGGKEVIPAEAMAEKVAAAVQARRHVLVVARTDARATHGLAEVIRRGRLYAEAGADVFFPEALESPEEFRAVAEAVQVPLLANMTEFGRTPLLPVETFRRLGYRLVIFPVTALRVAMRAVEALFEDLREKGSQADWIPRMQTRQALYELIRYEEYEALDRRLAGGEA